MFLFYEIFIIFLFLRRNKKFTGVIFNIFIDKRQNSRYNFFMDKRYHLDKDYIQNPLSFGETKLFQIGRMFCSESTVVPAHTHIDWFELTIVTEGEGVVVTNGTEVSVKCGDIYLSFPADFHELRSDPASPMKFDFFAFNTENEVYAEALKHIMESFFPADKRILRDENIQSIISNAISEFDHRREFTERLLSVAFEQVCIYLVRAFKKSPPASRRGDVTQAETLCFQMMNYIDTHIYSLKKLEELSDIFGYNYSYVSNLFKSVTSGTLSEYYRNRRMETARLLLREGKLKITEISNLLNYSSIYAFSKAFKERYGVSPKFSQ
ncbi:MAG: hypothetical protein DBX59_02025 [Bacillota bacterium]|nr:MAG: hypothetical protein DBX59_02025 [Bacillota bacterium]